VRGIGGGKDEILHGACPERHLKIPHFVWNDESEGFRMTKMDERLFDG